MAKKRSEEQTLANVSAAQLAAQVANWAAQLEFQKERMRLLEMPQFQFQSQIEIDRLAFQKAQDTWQRAIQEASVTGTYNGQPTLAWLTEQARMTGVINGQQTLEGKLNDAQIAQMNHSMTLQSKQLEMEREKFLYQQGLDAKQFGLSEAGVTGFYNGQSTLAREQMQGQQSQAYLQLLSSLQGPGNAFKQLRVLGNTPAGLRDLAAAWAGKYQMGGLTGSGQAPGQAQISDWYNQPQQEATAFGNGGYVPPGVAAPPAMMALPPGGVAPQVGAIGAEAPVPAVIGGVAPPAVNPGLVDPAVANPDVNPGLVAEPNPYAMTLGGPGGVAPPPGEAGLVYSPPGTQAPKQAYNYQPTPSGQTQMSPPGVGADPWVPQVSSTTPLHPSVASREANKMLLPNQINARNYANTNVEAQELGWAAFEDAGWGIRAAQDMFKKSLPKYTGPKQGTVTAGLGF